MSFIFFAVEEGILSDKIVCLCVCLFVCVCTSFSQGEEKIVISVEMDSLTPIPTSLFHDILEQTLCLMDKADFPPFGSVMMLVGNNTARI